METKKQSYKKIMYHSVAFILLGMIVSFSANLLLDWLHSGFDAEHVNELLDTRTRLYMMGSFILFILYSWFSALFGSKYLASGLLLIVSFSLGISSHFKMEYRGEPLYPMELRMFTQIPFILEMIEWQEMIAIILLFILLVATFIFIYFKVVRKQEKVFPTKFSYSLRLFGVLLASLCLVYIHQFNEQENQIKARMGEVAEWVTYDQPRNYESNGFLVGFIYNFEASPMEPLPDYSADRIDEIIGEYSERAKEINSQRSSLSSDVNVVYIMNETHSDPLRLEAFESNMDPLPFHREIIEESISGHSLAQGIGGGTANSEFEALSTLSMEAFAPNITTPYVQLTDQLRHMPNIVQMYKEMGYHATAIHSHHPRLYKRIDTYREFGFDEFLYDETMTHTHRIKDHHYISDDAAYKEVLEVLHSTDDPSFIHLVTMQNHMPHDSKYEDPIFDTEGSSQPDEANAYLQDLYYSDEALGDFISEIDQLEEETLVVFWGDHLPSRWRVYGNSSPVRDQNIERTFYETEYFIYGNSMDLEGDLGTRSPFYFNNHVMELLDLTVSPYQALLLELETVLPAFKDGIYVTADQQHVERKDILDQEVLDILNDYYLIQYDITSGRRYAADSEFFTRLSLESE